jgi:hypothetical protein
LAGPVDLVIAVTAELFDLTLLHHDRDFATIATMAGITRAGPALVRAGPRRAERPRVTVR